ncbi:MAG: tetratricopeptide repeat protein [Candidatus Eisenbacteria bacterium]|nr:tetratricopeptide repeat protein [Candidatus Eisenbacteria bacterium]
MKRRQAVRMKLTPLIAVVLTLSTVLLAGQQDSDRAVIAALVSARIDMMGTTSKEAAANKFTAIAAAFPESRYADDALLLSGRCLTSLQRYDDAIKVFRQIVDRYPKGALVVNGSWFSSMAEITGATSKGMPERLRKPPSELTTDAQEAVQLYESFMEAYPERTADWARYEMARIYHNSLHDDKRAREILAAIQENPIEAATHSKQDKIFQERMDALIMAPA